MLNLPASTLQQPTELQLRATRRLFARDYRPDQWIRVSTIPGMDLIGRRHILHPSAEVYLAELHLDHQDDYTARFYMINKKCQFKANGSGRPTDLQIQAWSAAYEAKET